MRRDINRRLRFWRYSASHSQLLLMSPIEPGNPTRFYVLLKAVGAIAAETDFLCDYVEISGGYKTDGGFAAPSGEQLDIQMVGPEGAHSFRAIALYFGEDDREYDDPVPIGIW